MTTTTGADDQCKTASKIKSEIYVKTFKSIRKKPIRERGWRDMPFLKVEFINF